MPSKQPAHVRRRDSAPKSAVLSAGVPLALAAEVKTAAQKAGLTPSAWLLAAIQRSLRSAAKPNARTLEQLRRARIFTRPAEGADPRQVAGLRMLQIFIEDRISVLGGAISVHEWVKLTRAVDALQKTVPKSVPHANSAARPAKTWEARVEAAHQADRSPAKRRRQGAAAKVSNPVADDSAESAIAPTVDGPDDSADSDVTPAVAPTPNASSNSAPGVEYLTQEDIEAKIAAYDAALKTTPPPSLPWDHRDHDTRENERTRFFKKQSELIAERRQWVDRWQERYGKQPRIRGQYSDSSGRVINHRLEPAATGDDAPLGDSTRGSGRRRHVWMDR